MNLLEMLGARKRLEILKLLSGEDMYVSQIMKLGKMDGKRTKHHLQKLEDAGIIQSYYAGRRKYYHLTKEIRLDIVPPPEGKFLLYATQESG